MSDGLSRAYRRATADFSSLYRFHHIFVPVSIFACSTTNMHMASMRAFAWTHWYTTAHECGVNCALFL